MATRQHLTNQANQAGVCFVLNEYREATEQIPLTSTASAAVDIKNTAFFNGLAMDEIWATEADHRTGWNKTFQSGTYRGMQYGIVFGDYWRQVVSLAKAKSGLTTMREFSLLGTKAL